MRTYKNLIKLMKGCAIDTEREGNIKLYFRMDNKNSIVPMMKKIDEIVKVNVPSI